MGRGALQRRVLGFNANQLEKNLYILVGIAHPNSLHERGNERLTDKAFAEVAIEANVTSIAPFLVVIRRFGI